MGVRWVAQCKGEVMHEKEENGDLAKSDGEKVHSIPDMERDVLAPESQCVDPEVWAAYYRSMSMVPRRSGT